MSFSSKFLHLFPAIVCRAKMLCLKESRILRGTESSVDRMISGVQLKDMKRK